ncbi:complex I assembly factor ACAD9, mitochondrial [Dendroctonus ponderosae]|uniref:Acyl-CoA dehydrogenase family member 9, mitochondrial n=2 Tax=Dendroctonus ponderosae TaxID=77166 RepID=A0AAR5P4B5_DENPD|nr:complex I assembly factor ACAD9, mitochondrial [Dendroctonus ponderosae]KAH1012789.1 hypothetical protein HUJ05_011885 [Dendroctonus ponderosae]KAH1012790.1 hypothetical protein HUJ05_011885 [Dendroctonus ponderosae]
MINLTLKRVTSNSRLPRKTLERLYSTSLNPVQKDTEEQYNKELKRFDRLTNIEKRTRPKKPQREPFVKNLLVGKYDNEILTFPELDLGEVRNVEKAVEELGKVLKQNHMVNVSSIGNKQFRQTLADYQAIGLQCSQFLDAKECCPMEFTRYLDTLAEHKLGANLIDNEVMGIQALNTFANVDLQKKYLYPLIKGEMVSAFAIIENELFDLKNMMTTAVLSSDKKHWVLNGNKCFVVNGISADFYVVLAVSEKAVLDSETVNSLSAFIVEKDSKGVSWKKLESANFEIADITFDNVQVPAENLLGPKNAAEKIAEDVIGGMRVSCGPACNAISRNMLNKLHNTFVENSGEFDLTSTDAVKSKLGEVTMQLYAAESVTYLTAGLKDWYENQDLDVENAIVKVVSSEVAYNISTTCLHMIGSPAALKDHWVRKCQDDIINYLTLHETNESLRMFISLNGLQHTGIMLSETIKKFRNPLHHGLFMLKSMFHLRDQYNDKPKLNYELYGNLHPSCHEPSKQLEYCCKRLQFVADILLRRHGLECVNKHADLRRIADIMIDCYTMTAVLARASRAYCIGLQFSAFEMMMASVYCNIATERVKDNVMNIMYSEYKANDTNFIAIGKRLIESKGHFTCNPITRFF